MFFPPSRNDSNRGKVFGGRGGRSKVELSAQEELAKAREERERRKRQKLEQKSAVLIQAAWRGWSSRCATRLAARSTWNERYGSDGEKLQAGDCLSIRPGGALGTLLSFYRPDADWNRLASVARVAAGAVKTDAFAAFVSSYNVAETRAALLFQLKALALQCLLTLSQRRRGLAPLLAAARPANPLDPATGGVAGALVECVLLLVSPDPYTTVLGKPAATSLAAAVLSHLAASGMCSHLFHLLSAALLPQTYTQTHAAAQRQQHHTQQQKLVAGVPAVTAAAPAAPTQHAVAAKPYVEALTTQLTVRLLALRSFSPVAPGDSLHALLFVPDLWRRCSSLAPVAGRLARAALMWLATAVAQPARLGALLAGEPGLGAALPGGGGTAVAVLLANVLAVAPRLLEPDRVAPGGQRALALAVVRVLHAAVSLLPLQPFFPDPAGGGGGGGGGLDDSDDEVDEAEAGSLGLARLALQPGAASALPAGLVEAVQGLTGAPGRQLVKQLVAVLLPNTGPQAAAPAAAAPAAPGFLPAPGAASALAMQQPQFYSGPNTVVGIGSPPGGHGAFFGGFGSPPAGGGGGGSSLAQRVSCHRSGDGARAPSLPQPPPLPPSQPSSACLLEAGEAAHALCEFLWQLAQLPGQQQRVLLSAAVSADLVERVWGAFLRPARLANLAGLTWLPDEAAGPRAAGGSPGSSTRATCSASSSFNCAGPVPMDVELPSATGAGGGAGGGSRSGSGCMVWEGGSGGAGGLGGLGGSGEGGAGMGGGGGCGAGGAAGSTWRPRLAEDVGWLLPLAVTCSAFSAQVATSTLEEFYGGGGGGTQRPLPLLQLYDPAAPEAGFLAMLRDALWQVLWSDGQTDRTPAGDALYAVLVRTGGLLYGILYERNCRRAFCPTEAFHATALAPDWFFTEASSSRSHAGREDGSARVWQVLRRAPALVPFGDRARLFQQMVAKGRQEHRAVEESRFLETGILDPGTGPGGSRFVQIRRDRLLFDGFDHLNSLGDKLRGRVRIMFIDAHGAPEAGVDGGGLFKDFMEELMRAGLSPEYGLFASNTSHQLYPNPAAMRVVEDAARLLAFLGQMLGKAMYENILLELPLAGFFLKKFRGAHCDLNDLPTLDPELYDNLLKLREHFTAAAAAAASSPGGPASPEGSQHGGGAAAADMDLGLTFVVADDAAAALGDPSLELELKPGGRHIPVTADNVNEYIHRLAHYKLNISPRPAVSAFLSGFYELIPRSWVSMFSGEELQTLISGAESRLDLEDMRAHVVYAGGYHEEHPVVLLFWEALEGFSPEELAKLLKFTTSCSRAPLLGFKYLEPPLCIQMSGAMLDPSAPLRLPTASTCLNLLKLPPYRSLGAMREKLLYALNSGAGFDLS